MALIPVCTLLSLCFYLQSQPRSAIDENCCSRFCWDEVKLPAALWCFRPNGVLLVVVLVVIGLTIEICSIGIDDHFWPLVTIGHVLFSLQVIDGCLLSFE